LSTTIFVALIEMAKLFMANGAQSPEPFGQYVAQATPGGWRRPQFWEVCDLAQLLGWAIQANLSLREIAEIKKAISAPANRCVYRDEQVNRGG